MNLWILFVIGAVLSWGAYGPALHMGRSEFPDKPTASLRALLCVGGAYFLVAVLIPVISLWWQGKLAGFTPKGVAISSIAGILGALGAACIIWSFQSGGKPLYVMPLVFGGAPLVNALITVGTHPDSARSLNPLLFVGFAMAAGGAWLVLRYLPS